MARWRQCGGMSLLLLLVAIFWARADGACYQDVLDGDGFSSLPASGGNYDPSTITLTICSSICVDTGGLEAAVENGLVCLCGTGGQLTGLSPSTCPTNCPTDNAECGGPDGLITGETAPLKSGPIVLTPVTSPVTTADVVQAAGSTIATVTEFIVSPGDGSPPFVLTGTPAAAGTDFSTSLDYLAPGTYMLSVMSPSAASSTQVTVQGLPMLVRVDCPPLVQPTELYSCTAGVGGSNLQLTATFSDDSISMAMTPPETPWQRVGHPPPHGTAQAPVQVTPAELVFTLSQPFTQRTQLMALHWHGAGAGDCQLTLMEGSCSDASQAFCPSSGQCAAHCPLVTGTSNYTCDVSEPVFCPFAGQCSMSDGTCAARAAPILSATSVAAVDFTTATDAYGKLLLADSNTWAEPGWFAKVTCTTGGAVSWITVPADQGDMGDTSTDKQYMIELLGLPQTPIGIPHTCAGMSDITLIVSDGGATITNTTACQIPVGLITVEVEQKGALVPAEAAPPPSDNFSGAFFAEANVDITFKVTIQKGAPVLLEYSFDESSSGVANHSEDIQRPVVPSEVFTHTVRFTSSGTFTVRVTGTNKHSVPEQPEYSELTVTVQHPVTVDWLPALDTAASKFLVTVVGTKEPAAVVFEMRLPSADQLPTDASMTINFDDGYTKDELLLSDGSIGLADNTPTSAAVDGFFVAGFNHGFERRGNFSVQITMKNRISEESDTIEVMVEEKIIGLEAPVRQNLDDRKDELLDGLGKDENEYRNDRNLTFSFNLLQGSMTMVKLFNDSNGEHVLLATFTFIDKDNPTDEIFVYHIDTNQELTLSFVGVNTYEETEPVPAVVIIQDPITEITRLILALDEEQPEDYMMKKFTASWTSASTMQMCLAIHFGDASPLVTYGDEVMCETKYPKAVNMPALLENPMPFEFQYWVKGVYNVSINVLNPKDDESYELLVSVSNVACSNPIVSIIGASEAREEPPTYLMSQNIVIEAHAELNCDASMTTKKRWEIIHIVTDDAESAHIMHQLNHWDKADLVVPRNFLNPGLYMLLYTMTMQDQGIEDGDIFQTQTKAYIEIERTPLHAGFIMGAVSKIVRGWNQPIVLDGVTHSYDPDDMSSKEFTFQWYCRRLGDERADALNATTPPQSLTGRQAAAPVPDPDLGGCFGEGPGRLDLDGGWLEINTEFLQPYQQSAVTYIITVVVGKDDRRSMAEVQVAMSEGSPPLIEVQCADVVLCSPSLEGVTVNPQHILGLRGGCFDGECPVPLDWAWSLSTVNDDSEVTAIENTEQYLPTPNAQEVRISNTLFSDFPDVKFLIVLEASDNAEGNPPGKAMYFVTVNKPPEVDGKLCTCSPITGRALLDDFSIKCQNPVDPEGFPVESFQFFTTVAGKTEQLAVKKIPELTIRLPLGINQLQYIAEDRQGASARKDVCAPIDATQPSAEELQAFLDSKDVLSLAGTGDARSAIPIILAVASLQNTAEKDAMPPEERLLAEVKDAAYRDNMFKTVENMAATSKEAIALKSVALNALMSAGSGRPQSIDMSTNKNALNVIESLSEAVGDAGFATVESMVVVLDSILRTASVIHENLAYTTSSESCEEIPLADLNKAPLMPVDNAIDYSKKPEILSREKELKCSVRDAARREAKDLDDRLTRALERAQKATMQRMVLEQSVEFETPRGGATRMSIKKGLGGNNETVGEAAIAWPSNMTINDGKPVAVSVSDTAVNSKTTVEGAGTISTTSRLLSVNIFRRNLEPLKIANVSEGILMKISQTYRNTSNGSCTDCPLPPSKINSTEALKGKLLAVVYSMINITKPHSAFNIEFTAYDGPVNDVFVMISFGHMPTLRNHSLLKMVTDFPYEESPEPDDIDATEKYRWFVSSDWVDNREGAVYVGIGQFNSSSAKYNDTMAIVNGGGDFSKFKSKEILGKEFTVKMYKLQTYTSSCAFYDEEMSMWTSEGLQVIESDLHSVTCNSSHLTSFASGLFVQPNTIDFAYVFANASFTDNLTIYMTLIILLVMYLLLLIWARWQDKKDVEKLGALPLPDNKTNSKYLYEIMLFTGHKADAATDSNVSFVLTGDDYDSGTRTFGKPKRRFFRKGGQDAFVMAVPGYLGDLKYLRIWHDNSGKGRFASWFLQYVLVRNIQTGEMTTFVCNEWLAVEYDDGLIDRLIPVAGKEQMRDFATVFPHTSQQSLSDGHLWFSVFLRPPRSRFTRMQRVSCCFALLFLSMMVNAMWYDRVPSQATAGAIKLGPLSLSPEEIAVGVMSNIIVFVPSLLIVFLFRKSRPRKLRESRIDTAMQKGRGEESKQASASGGEDAGDVTQDIGSESRKASLASSIKSGSSSKQKKAKKRRFTLPWWGVIIGWILCILCLFGSAFIVYAYGITFGNEKATKWVTSLFISLFSSILLIQPLKVFVSALVISAIFKNVDLGSDDANEDEQDPQLSSDEEWFMGSSGKTHASVGSSSPYDKETLETIRKQRIKEIEMGVIVREILSYSFFLWILVVLSFDNRDPNAFYLQKNMENAFIKVGDNTGFTTWLDFSKVSNTSAFWYWSQNVIMQELRAQTWYDGITPALGLRGFLDDRVNRIVGRATMRQIRSLPNTCTIHGAMRSLIGSCQGYTSIVSEDTNSYCANWTERGSRADCSRVEYRYSSASNLQNLPVVAKQDVYGGGGFVFQLSGAQNKLLKQMARLEKENWIDSLTRAVFIEFSVYNAQVNLFGVATIYVELTPGGGMNPLWRFDGVRLTKQAGSQAFVIICEILYVLFIIYFIVREVRLIRKQKKEYLKQYSSYAEWVIILLSFTGLIVYIMRFIETDSILATFKETYGNGYVKLTYAQLLDDLYGYIVGIIVFIATLKFIKLLRFNRRIGMLSATLKQTWNDLTGFLVIFTIAIGSFGLLFNLLLVASMNEFKDWLSAVESCFAMMLNKFEFMEMYRGSFLASIMFFLFAIYMNLIFVNVLLTIILKGFEQVKNDVTKQPNDYEVVDFVMRRFKKFIGINAVTPLRDVVAEHQREQEESKNVRQLPDKVSTFIDQINHTYFDGKLDLNDKKQLKKTLRQAKHEQRGRPKSMEGFQRDEEHMTKDQQLLDQL